ncbi:MAG: HAMP domain-containing histidine kinase, partial [Anaerolineae bacterium]|nr:HAMP domain-containing histidine kinase [Anaerolineae bacterium]
DLMRAQAVALYTYQEEVNCFEHLYTAGVGIPTPDITHEYTLDENSPVVLLKNGDQPLLFDDPTDLEVLQQAFGLSLFPTSAIASPLIARGTLTGFLLVLRISRDDFYTPEDAQTLFSLAGAAGLALRSAQLFTSLDRAYSELQDLDRRKSEFVAITSHELRTPIAIMLGYASLLADDESDPSRKSQLEAIEKQAQFLSGMVDALINLHELQGKSQPIVLNCQSVRVDKLLEDAVEAARSTYKNSREMNVILNSDPIELIADEVRLVLAFTNLVDNAFKFNKDGGHLTITAVGLPEGGAVITFEDDGIGIPESEYEKIFEPFYQLEGALTRRYGGMGLGLAIVRGMIELHDGTITVKSRVESGTRFIVTLRQRPPENRCVH